MAERAGTSLRDSKIPDDDGALANEVANRYLAQAHADALKILQPVCSVYPNRKQQTVSSRSNAKRTCTQKQSDS